MVQDSVLESILVSNLRENGKYIVRRNMKLTDPASSLGGIVPYAREYSDEVRFRDLRDELGKGCED